MKSNHIHILLFVLVLFLLFSCENEYEVDMKKEHTVLHGLAFEGESPKIILAKTLEVFPDYPFNLQYYSQPFYTDNVEIIVTSENEVYTDFELHQIPIEISEYDNNKLSEEINYYSNDAFIPEAGKEYTIEVYELETYPTVKRSGFSLKSTTTIPEELPITLKQLPDKINTENLQYEPNDTSYNQVYNIAFDDPKDEENFYYLTLSTVICNSDFSIDTIDMDKLWNNYTTNSPDYYWLNNLKFYDSKISGLGDIDYENNIYELQGFLFSDIDFGGQTKTIEVEIKNYLYGTESFKFFVVELFHVSEEYYNYYLTLHTQGKTQEDIFTEPTQIYSNIDGGLGVFAGASLTTSNIKVIPMPE